MYPKGKVTDIQERQMTSILDSNVHCISIDVSAWNIATWNFLNETKTSSSRHRSWQYTLILLSSLQGDFDDAQLIVKDAFADVKFREEVKLGAINSINWGRILAQITYYFYSWLRVTDGLSAAGKAAVPINYAVPTGNFGDILAGYFAKRMGLPVDRLVVCANENDVLHRWISTSIIFCWQSQYLTFWGLTAITAFNLRFLETGVYQKTPATLTIAPSMDISVSSNFERYLFYLAGSSSDTLKSWMDAFEGQGEIKVPAELLMVARSELASYSSSKSDIVTAMRDVFDREKYLVCPHTATAVVAVRELGLKASRTVILATAHPAKFEEAVALALVDGRVTPARPKILNDLFVMPTRSTHLPNSLAEIEHFVRSKISTTKKKSAGGLIQASSVFTVAALGVGIYVIYAFAMKRGR